MTEIEKRTCDYLTDIAENKNPNHTNWAFIIMLSSLNILSNKRKENEDGRKED